MANFLKVSFSFRGGRFDPGFHGRMSNFCSSGRLIYGWTEQPIAPDDAATGRCIVGSGSFFIYPIKMERTPEEAGKSALELRCALEEYLESYK